MISKLLKDIQTTLKQFENGSTFKINELFEPIVWEVLTRGEKNEIASDFRELVLNELKDTVKIIEDDSSDLFKKYMKISETSGDCISSS